LANRQTVVETPDRVQRKRLYINLLRHGRRCASAKTRGPVCHLHPCRLRPRITAWFAETRPGAKTI